MPDLVSSFLGTVKLNESYEFPKSGCLGFVGLEIIWYWFRRRNAISRESTLTSKHCLVGSTWSSRPSLIPLLWGKSSVLPPYSVFSLTTRMRHSSCNFLIFVATPYRILHNKISAYAENKVFHNMFLGFYYNVWLEPVITEQKFIITLRSV